MTFTLDTTIGELIEDPRANQVLEAHSQGITTNPMVAFISRMTVREVLAMPQAAAFNITAEKIEKVLAEINQGNDQRVDTVTL